MNDRNKKYYSEDRWNKIMSVFAANLDPDVIKHCINRLDWQPDKDLNRAFEQFKSQLEESIFSGLRSKASPDLEHLISKLAEEAPLDKPLQTLALDIRYVAQNEDIGQEAQISPFFSLGPDQLPINAYLAENEDSSNVLIGKLMGVWKNEWLRMLGLDYNYEKSSIVDRQTGQVPTLEVFKTTMLASGDMADRNFIKAAKSKGLLEDSGDFSTSVVVHDFENRQRADSIAAVPAA